MRENKKIIVKNKGKVIGFYYEYENETFLFEKFVIPRKHLFLKYDGYGIQKTVFDKLFKDKEGSVRIQEEFGAIYLSDIKSWKERGITVNIAPFGEQIILPIKEMVEDVSVLNI